MSLSSAPDSSADRLRSRSANIFQTAFVAGLGQTRRPAARTKARRDQRRICRALLRSRWSRPGIRGASGRTYTIEIASPTGSEAGLTTRTSITDKLHRVRNAPSAPKPPNPLYCKQSIFLHGRPSHGRGKELSGIAAAEADLFRNSKYALISGLGNDPALTSGSGNDPGLKDDPRVAEFVALLNKFGAEPVWLTAEAHDRAAAIISHLPQLLSVALAGVVRDADGRYRTARYPGGRGLRDALRPWREAPTRSGGILS